MRMLCLSVALVGLLSIAFAAVASADTIDFDSYVNDVNGGGEVTGSEWIGQGIVFSTPDLQLNLGETTGSSPNSLGADVLNDDFDGQLNFQFTGGAEYSDVSFIVFNPPFGAKAYNAANVLVHTIIGGADFTQTFDFSGYSVNRVELSGSLYAIDDVTFNTNPVPEPGSLALLGMGFAGFGLMRRRSSRRA